MQYRRNFQPGGTFFFTVVTYQRQRIFQDARAVELLRSSVREQKTRRPFRIEAWVVLPEHLHMIWTLPRGDADFSTRWSGIKSDFSRRWVQAGGREAYVGASNLRQRRRGIWQRKFIEHTIRDEDDFINHVEYIHYNPVKHELVDCPINWDNSSLHEFVSREIYPHNWCCQSRNDQPHPQFPHGDYLE